MRCLALFGPASFVSGSRDGTLKLWSLSLESSSSQCITTFSGHSAPIVSLACDPASGLIASGSQDATCRIWDASQGTSISTISGHEGSVCSLAFLSHLPSDNDRQQVQLITGGLDGQVKLWDALSGSLLSSLDGHKGLVGHILAVDAGEGRHRLVVTAGVDGCIKVWDFDSTAQLQWEQKSAHWGGVTKLDSSDQHVISAGADGKVKVWHLGSGKMMQILADNLEAVYKVACKHDASKGFVLVSRQDGWTLLSVSDNTSLSSCHLR